MEQQPNLMSKFKLINEDVVKANLQFVKVHQIKPEIK